jgi:hypothetical protein
MLNFKHEFGVGPHILTQIVIVYIHKVTKFASRNVVGILWDEFRLNTLLEEFPCVARGLPFFLPHRPPPCGGIALQIGLGKFDGRMPTDLGGMKVIFHYNQNISKWGG